MQKLMMTDLLKARDKSSKRYTVFNTLQGSTVPNLRLVVILARSPSGLPGHRNTNVCVKSESLSVRLIRPPRRKQLCCVHGRLLTLLEAATPDRGLHRSRKIQRRRGESAPGAAPGPSRPSTSSSVRRGKPSDHPRTPKGRRCPPA